MCATLTLGREGMGADATEEDYARWVAFVNERIDTVCGFIVDVETRPVRSVQNDCATGDDIETVLAAKESLWETFCSHYG